jgi:hypothetical protein
MHYCRAAGAVIPTAGLKTLWPGWAPFKPPGQWSAQKLHATDRIDLQARVGIELGPFCGRDPKRRRETAGEILKRRTYPGRLEARVGIECTRHIQAQ